MKRILLLVFLTCGSFRLNAKIIQADTVIINGTKFLFIKCTEKNENSAYIDTLLKIYRIEKGNRKYLLKQAIYTKNEDCNSVFINHGTCEVKGDSIIFMTEFDFDQSKNFGLPSEEKQVYIVKNDGKMILVYDAERYDDEWRLKNN